MSAHPQLYLTAPAPCPYLEGRMERKVFTHLVGEQAQATHNTLVQSGFRRSQQIAYRPACEGCKACTPTRVPVDRFRPTKSMRRIRKRNSDLVAQIIPNEPTSEHYSLFRSYIDGRHGEGGMHHMTALDFAMMVEDSHVDTVLVEYRRRGPDSGITGKGVGPLVAVALTDRLADGFSMVYSFFDPAEEHRSPGVFMILSHIELAAREGLPYCHLGYLVKDSPKMAYKGRFLPQQRLASNGWFEVES